MKILDNSLEFTEELSAFYNLTSMVFASDPTTDFCNALRDVLLEDYFPLTEHSEEMSKYHKELQDKLKETTAEEFLKAMKDEHYQMFFDPHGMLASPWQSTYESSDRLLFQEAHREAKKMYRRHHFRLENNHFPGDHIAIELDFLKRLCEKEIEKLENDHLDDMETLLRDHKTFCENHILAWMDKFIYELGRSDSFYYHRFACMIQEVGKLDQKQLTTMLEEGKEC